MEEDTEENVMRGQAGGKWEKRVPGGMVAVGASPSQVPIEGCLGSVLRGSGGCLGNANVGQDEKEREREGRRGKG